MVAPWKVSPVQTDASRPKERTLDAPTPDSTMAGGLMAALVATGASPWEAMECAAIDGMLLGAAEALWPRMDHDAREVLGLIRRGCRVAPLGDALALGAWMIEKGVHPVSMQTTAALGILPRDVGDGRACIERIRTPVLSQRQAADLAWADARDGADRAFLGGRTRMVSVSEQGTAARILHIQDAPSGVTLGEGSVVNVRWTDINGCVVHAKRAQWKTEGMGDLLSHYREAVGFYVDGASWRPGS